MKWHKETRPLPVYVLVRMNAETLGPGLVPIDKDCSPGCGFRMQSDGKKIGETTWPTILAFIRTGASARGERYVLDHTGLTGPFRVDAEWSDRPNPNDERPLIFTAVREQLGLRLEPRVEPVEVFVIDSLERPTPD